ncbi:MAG: hypothetical protein CVT96_05515 [Bacteroidetes bacterium HGW-Bacteroidetes-13]|nr:MAG: hypothetical protein CVT96_05515 [Bacteroidetes bacterium HGW-Bacteroidetes-13]
MKTLELNQMENLVAGSNRQCFLDGVFTLGATILGGVGGGFVGAGLALLGGLFAGNANGCFDK